MEETPVAMVTGSSRGIGRGIAEYFLREGYRVVGCSRGPSDLIEGDYEHTVLDVGCDQQVWKWVTGVARSHGRIDVVVNNAGMSPPAALAVATPAAATETALRTNFLGTSAVCREAAKVMLKRKFGRIINISTIAVGLHLEGASAYVASKGAIVEFSKVLAKELAPTGITANIIAISIADTGMAASLSDPARERLENGLAISRWATIEDICHVISFFASPASGYITGQIMNLGFVD